ncbi:sulfotransferase [Sphingobium bisphenolivorans]|uniref:sulfotransferase n=1 Tax=Sphingobium bisphenolivorans TaxID=1335760 RepID=UPI0003A52BFA|nr:sulfotransferase [Sphingobium bisphenolivorans]
MFRHAPAPTLANEPCPAPMSGAERAPLLIHIGFHKTGSTWLQQQIFGSADHGFTTETGRPRHQIVHDFVTADAFQFSPDEARASYARHIAAAKNQGWTLVVSHERLSGYPSSGGHDRRLIADRLHATFPQARILMILREQRSLIRSMYSQHITDGGTGSLRAFLASVEPHLGRRPGFRLSTYEFDGMIQYYQRLFGRDKLLVLPYEMLAEEPAWFVARIQDFCGFTGEPVGRANRANEGRSLLMQLVQRRLNALFYDNELSPGALVAIPRFAPRFGAMRGLFEAFSPRRLERYLHARLRDQVEAHVGSHYAQSNWRTQELTGLDLARYGYPVSEPLA